MGLVDFVFPPRCPMNGQVVEGQGMLTSEAWQNLNFINDPQCVRCGMPFEFMQDSANEISNDNSNNNSHQLCGACIKYPPIFNQARSVLVYNDASRDIILGFKHGDKTQNVATFAPWLRQAGDDMLRRADFLMPIPLHPFRLMKRRFNQSGILAQYLSKEINIPVLIEGLIRTRSTPVQGHLRRDERKKNVRHAFSLHPSSKALIKNKNIVLIDDVFTTGATVTECAKTLLKNQAGTVSVLTLARVVKGV